MYDKYLHTCMFTTVNNIILYDGYDVVLHRKLETLKEPDQMELPTPESFLKVKNFDCDVQACINDPRKALSYQTGR